MTVSLDHPVYVRGGQQLLLEGPHCYCHTDSVTTTATGEATQKKHKTVETVKTEETVNM